MLRRVTSVAKLGLVMGVATLLAACTPANTTNTGFLAYEPNPGYEWADADGWSWAVVWKPGKAHPTQPRVFASQTPGDWVPALGYAWVSQDSSDLRVAWKQGLTYDSLPHVTTDSKEGTWTADPGYAFKRPDSLEVFWQAGRGHPQKPHFVAAAQEGSWDVEAGYRKVTNVVGGEWAEWSPGSAHPGFPNVYAASQEGYWVPASGYTFASAGSLDVVPLPSSPTYASSSPTEPPSAAARFFGGLLKAVVAQQFAESQPDDGVFATAVGRPAARAIRDDAIDEMADAVKGN